MAQLHVLMMPDYRQDNPYQSLLAQSIEQHDVQVYFPVGYRRIFPIFRAILEQPKPIDILHLHWLEPYLTKTTHPFINYLYTIKFIIDIILVRLIGTKLIWTIHNQLDHDTQFPRLERWTRKILVKLAKRLIVHNHSILQMVSRQDKFSPSHASVIAHGHYRNFYHNPIDKYQARQQLNLPLDKRIYLHLGMIRPYKGIENLLQVWQTQQTILKDSFLLIVGKSLNQEYAQNIAEQIAQIKNVFFEDHFVANDKIHLYFSAADIVVLPYRNILTSGSAILAMSFGKPLIAPKIGSLPEILGKADALLYDPEDDEGLEAAIKKSLDSNLEELSNLVITACDDLDWQQIGEKTVKTYQ
ncbi:MAG: glycosyltransferase [Gloeotrichia echinulata GP01]|jgi:beta-1,4-mannosyltransferase